MSVLMTCKSNPVFRNPLSPCLVLIFDVMDLFATQPTAIVRGERRIRTQSTYVPPDGEHNDLPSVTRPGDAMTLRELHKRHEKRIPIPDSSLFALYEGEDSSGISIDRLDLSERMDLAEAARASVEHLNTTKKEKALKLAREKYERDVEERIRKKIAEDSASQS